VDQRPAGPILELAPQSSRWRSRETPWRSRQALTNRPAAVGKALSCHPTAGLIDGSGNRPTSVFEPAQVLAEVPSEARGSGVVSSSDLEQVSRRDSAEFTLN